jgi:hypothetical protein
MNAAFPHSSPAEIARILAETAGPPPLPPATDRSAWSALARQEIAAEVIALAERWAAEPIPHLPLSLYLDYHQTGHRTRFEDLLNARRDRLVQLALAECLEGRGRFLAPVADALDATLAEFTWVIPAHGSGKFTKGLPMPDLHLIDLWSAMACLLVAEVDHLIGSALHPVLRTRVRRTIAERGTGPLLQHDDFFWMGARETGRSSPNWAPVCAGLTAGAALYVELDRDVLALVIAKALREIGHYVGSFPPDGGCAEGMGYWEKGVFAFATFAHLLSARTEGRLDPICHPALREIALFPYRMQIGPQLFPLFSDNAQGRVVQGALLRHLAERLGLPQLASVDPVAPGTRRFTTRYPAEQIRDFLWWRDMPTDTPAAPADWLPDTEIFVARLDPTDPASLVLAAKAGHNSEPHNHNDVGSFVIAFAGQTPVAELGAGEYTRATFDPAQRYQMVNYSSLGHSVPVVNGQAQAFGPQYAARDVRREGDWLSMDLAACYPPEAGVTRLIRTLSLDRTRSQIELVDDAAFEAEGLFQSVLISLDKPQAGAPGQLRLGPIDVAHDPELVVLIEPLGDLSLRTGGNFSAWRVVLSPPETALRQRTVLVFTPGASA